MVPWLTPPRRHDPELMDQPGLPEAEVEEAYRVLRRVNRQLGNRWALNRELERFLKEDWPGPAASLLDLGSGSADLPLILRRELERRGVSPVVLALDRDPTACTLGARQGMAVIRGDALRLPFADRSFDMVSAVKFAHHFSGVSLSRLLAEMARVAARRVVVLDIRRHWMAYWGFVAWSRAFTSNRLVRYDGPLSVLRGFTRGELAEVVAPLKDFSWEVRAYPGFQLALVGRRSPMPGR